MRNGRSTGQQVLERARLRTLGCLPFTGCASCCGSPSNTMLLAACEIASTFASESFPASSTTSHRRWLAAHTRSATLVVVPGGHIAPRDAEEENSSPGQSKRMGADRNAGFGEPAPSGIRACRAKMRAQFSNAVQLVYDIPMEPPGPDSTS